MRVEHARLGKHLGSATRMIYSEFTTRRYDARFCKRNRSRIPESMRKDCLTFWLTCLVTICSLAPALGQTPSPSPTPQRRFPRPAPKYKVRIEKSVMVPMSDGVKLSTDLYFPEGAGDKLPVIVIRTPYDKSSWRQERYPSVTFAGQGYVVAVQDVRGRFESEGEYIVSAADAKDGVDMVNWATVQPWSNG